MSSSASAVPSKASSASIGSAKADSKKFYNPGLERFEKIRAEFTKIPPGKSAASTRAVIAQPVDIDDVIERIASGAPLPKPVPLGQMIDILIDLWEADGLFD